ncbi:glycosyltransferase family 39 protein [Actinoplanes utahensis]|uniref:Glycosyltransferase RgtA/B/C/D-like domain-containing protein n=1 Tax=Actinoplanes utahensis TaxID=1869 RepID=A0A0A6UWE0_ACTUT|nr:glycosyltransferase family 39 protein [Actinoplanes utahensis]KHD79223.1 hypothetical protein MB27_00985 [Actinoplanes utahensis]GIF30359.1 hypothetical protein Aut01nite_33450 [Actinoplanes utahensis]
MVRAVLVTVPAFAVPGVTAAVLAGWALDRPAFWADELATRGAIALDWDQLWQLSESVDAVLTPYYVVLKFLTGGAGDAVALRLPSLIAVVATTLVVVALGRRAGGETTGLLSGLLFAVLPVSSRYAQEARPYAFVMLFAALSLLALLLLLDRPTLWRAVGYAAAVAVTGLFHPLSALLMLAGHAVIGWRRWKLWTIAAAVGSLTAIVISVRAAGQAAQVSWIDTVDTDTVRRLPEQLFVSGIAGGLVLGLAVAGLRRDRVTMALAGAGLLPPALLLIAGTVAPVWVARYALVAVPALVVLAVRTAARTGRIKAALVVALTAFLAYPAQLDIRQPDGHWQDSSRIADVILPYQLDGDVVVFPDNHPSIGWAARDIYETYVPMPRPPDVLAIAPQRADGHFLARECDDVAACLGAPPRIWIVRADTAIDPLQDMSPAKQVLIHTGYRVKYRWNYRQLSVILMEQRPPKTPARPTVKAPVKPAVRR